ncbi:unnamed protein product, partial [Echinostoma caproni]|uniref:Peptidase A2 domain-containing protein n=1 Tax=Echinostoma caproni TaxID=27848 RepID=A0A183BEC2_9TREM
MLQEALQIRDGKRIGRLFFVRDYHTNARFLVDTGTQVSVFPVGSSKPRATTLRLCAVNGTPIPTFGTRQLTVNLGWQRRYPWTFILANVPTGIMGIDFLQYYELLVDSRCMQLINPASNIKVTGLKARTDVYRITGLMPDIPVDFQTLIARFPTLTKPIEDLTLVTDRVAHYVVTKGPPVTARPRRLAPNKLAFAK